MKIAIDGFDTLVGQTIAELIHEKLNEHYELIAILHGDFADISEENDSQLNNKSNVKIENCFLKDLDFTELNIVFIDDNQDHIQLTLTNALEQGVKVIDCAGNTNPYDEFLLIVHDINSHEFQGLTPGFVIATPSAGATMLSQVLRPLLQSGCGVERVNVCHLAPAANLGKVGVEQLASQTTRLLNGMPLPKKQRLEQMAFNLLPQTGAIDENEYTETETQLIRETKRLLGEETLLINASVVQAPVFYAQSQVIDLNFYEAVDPDQVAAVLRATAGIRITAAKQASPVAIQTQTDQFELVISRIRQNPDDKRSLTLWCASDNLRRGPAGNAVQIADLLIKSYL